MAKGVGILLVVLGHLIGYFGAPLTRLYPVIYLFHVPLFFFLSGLFFHQDEAWIPFLKKKFLRLYLPYLLASTFFFLVEWMCVRFKGDLYEGTLGPSSLWKAILGIQPMSSMLTMPTWFILVLFRVFILYKLMLISFGRKRWLTFLVCMVLAIVGIWLKLDCAMIGQTLVSLPFFCLGHWVGPEFFNKKHLWGLWQSVAFFALSATVLVILAKYQNTNIALGVYGHTALLFTAALIGIMMVFWSCSFLSRMTWLEKMLTYIGRHTLAILIWHVFVLLIVFKSIELAGGKQWMPAVWAVVYILAFCLAILVPCLANKGWHYMVQHLKASTRS